MRLRHLAEYAALSALSLVCRAGAGARVAAGRLVGFLLSVLDGRRARVLGNLSRAVGARRARDILPRYYEHLGMLVAEYAALSALRPGRIADWIEPRGAETLKAVAASGRGVIIMTGHVGNWELTGYALAGAGLPLSSLYRPPENPLLDARLKRVREACGMEVREKLDSALWAMRVLKSGRALGLLMDQDGGAGGVFVPFFGELASTLPAAARLARRTGAAIFPVTSARLPGGRRHILRVFPEVVGARTGDEERDVLVTTRRCCAALERAILDRPAQWLWRHRRWQTRPRPEDLEAWDRARGFV